MVGLLAAAHGRPQDSDNSDLDQLAFTIRVDRPGVDQRDWHTIGGGYPAEKTVQTASGERRKAAVLRENWYLADAAFTVAVTGQDDVIARTSQALAQPVFPPYLGRRSCPPDSPIYVASHADPDGELHRLPLHRPRPQMESDAVTVLFVYESPPGESSQPPTRELLDAPIPSKRSWTTRPIWEVRRSMPGRQCAGYGPSWIRALIEYRSNICSV